jgi:hypothetical protein
MTFTSESSALQALLSLSLSWPDHKQSFRPVPAVKLLGIVFPPLFTLFQPKMVGVISPSLIEMPLGGPTGA